MKRIIFIIMMMAAPILCFTIGLTDELVKFKVYGNCEMCKKRIETSLKKPGIKSANWNEDTKMIAVVFDPKLISLDNVHKSIAGSGYDTEKEKASDKDYNSLPECCQYKRKDVKEEKHTDHKH